MGIARWGILAALAAAGAGWCGAHTLPSQQSSQSAKPFSAQSSATKAKPADPVVAAAKNAREQEKNQSKPAKVWTNDDIPSSGGLSVTGAPESNASKPAEQNSSAGANGSEGNGANNSEPGDAAQIQAQLDAAKKNLKDLQSQLDLLQRTYKLDQQMYYVKPDYSSDTAGAAKLKDEAAQISAKQQDVAAAQKQVDDLQAKLDAAKHAPDDSKQ